MPRVGSTEQFDSTSFNVASVVHDRETENLALVGPPFFYCTFGNVSRLREEVKKTGKDSEA